MIVGLGTRVTLQGFLLDSHHVMVLPSSATSSRCYRGGLSVATCCLILVVAVGLLPQHCQGQQSVTVLRGSGSNESSAAVLKV